MAITAKDLRARYDRIMDRIKWANDQEKIELLGFLGDVVLLFEAMEGHAAKLDELDRRTINQVRLGPLPEDPAERERITDELVEAAGKALDAAEVPPADQNKPSREEAEKLRRGLEVLKQKSEEHGAAVCTTDGRPPDPDYAALGSAPRPPKPGSAQHESYYVLCENERAKGFVRPVRRTYQHVGIRPTHPTRELTADEHGQYDQLGYVKYEAYPPEEKKGLGRYWTQKQLESGCNTTTTMGLALAETYARDPGFYGATFCCHCCTHLPLEEFVWEGTNERVGS